MTAKDWTLLVVAAAGGQQVSPVQLQKALFLLGENLSKKRLACVDFYEFQAYDYGPFTSQVYDDAFSLANDDLVRIQIPPGQSYREYVATPAGRARASLIRGALDPGSTAYLDKVVGWVQSLSFNELVSAIYKQYPKMKVNSVFNS